MVMAMSIAMVHRWGEAIIRVRRNGQSIDWLQVQWLRTAVRQRRRHHRVHCELATRCVWRGDDDNESVYHGCCIGAQVANDDIITGTLSVIIITIIVDVIITNLHAQHSCWCSTVVERRSLTGELSLSCARPAADEWPLMWVNHPLQVSQLGQLTNSEW